MVNFLINKLPGYFEPTLTIRRKHLVNFFLALLLTFIIHKVIVAIVTVKIPIFGFHDIVDIQNPKEMPPLRPDFQSDYSQQDLEVFLDYLVSHNYWFMSTQELYDYYLSNPRKPIPAEHRYQKKVMVTFDDGYKSVYTHLLPILEKLEKKYGKKAKVILFINPAFMGRHGTVLDKANCQELREGFQKGFYDLQSHGLNHENLTTISFKSLERELAESQIQLRKCTQGLDGIETVASHIAYPYGAVNKEVEKSVAKYYLSGYLYNSLTFSLSFFKPQSYYISRLTVNKKHSVGHLENMAAGGWLRNLIRTYIKVIE
ncbi:polysaccharide deacetylase [Oscillatoriales cyanobacterium USR001]|nr:polysaccharide deacetylase [Oscillatoriales cyanobacterium USR001]